MKQDDRLHANHSVLERICCKYCRERFEGTEPVCLTRVYCTWMQLSKRMGWWARWASSSWKAAARVLTDSLPGKHCESKKEFSYAVYSCWQTRQTEDAVEEFRHRENCLLQRSCEERLREKGQGGGWGPRGMPIFKTSALSLEGLHFRNKFKRPTLFMNVFQMGQPYMPVTAEQNGQQNEGHAGETGQLDDIRIHIPEHIFSREEGLRRLQCIQCLTKTLMTQHYPLLCSWTESAARPSHHEGHENFVQKCAKEFCTPDVF